MTSTFFRRFAIAIVTLLVGSGSSFAQESTHKPASLAFDINGQAIMQSKLVVALQIPPAALGRQAQVLQAKRFFGAVSLPESLEALNQMRPDSPVPVEFMAVAEFDTKEAREKTIPTSVVANSKKVTVNGKEYCVEPRVENLLLLLEEKRFEIGTKPYLSAARASLLTSTLRSAMGELGKAPAKIVVDLTQDREVILTALDQIKKQGVPPTVGPFLDLPKRMDQLLISIDPDGDEIIKLVSRSSKPDDAAFVSKTLNALVGLGKMSYQSAPKEMPGVEVGQALLNAISVKVDGNTATLILKKPANFEEMLARTKQQANVVNARMQKMNDVKQLLLAMLNYQDTYQKLPFLDNGGGILSENLSWRVRVLPFFEQVQLYHKFDLKQDWNSDQNKPLADQCPELYGKDGKTDKCWVVSEVKKFRDITDGTSNTICLIQTTTTVPWTQAKDITIEEAEKMISGLPDGQKVIVGMYDGSVRELDNQIPAEKLHALLTPNGGERIDGF
ncbi:MAG: DUF1559 domain-containing protein [Pirellulales bacterium]